MTRTIVIFDSKYGFTEQYARWISAALGCPAVRRKDFDSADFSSCETIIYGGGLYAGGVSGIRLLTEHWNQLSGRNVVLFTCGLADPADPDNAAHIRTSLSKALSAEMMEKIHLFHLRGGIDYARLNLKHKAMMAMLRRWLLRKDPGSLRIEDRQLLETYGKQIDFTSQSAIEPLIRLCISLQES